MVKKLLFFFVLSITIFSSQKVFSQKNNSTDEIFAGESFDDQKTKLNEDIALYPNPVITHFSVRNDSDISISKIEFHSIVGNRVKVIYISVRSQLDAIYIDDLKRGIYFVTLYFENNQTVSQKILKK